MERPANYKWKKLCASKNINTAPVPRWGHACIVIQDELIVFGGYADSNYMNDLWSYNCTKMQWKQIKTTGQVPTHRSNCTMNYDVTAQKLIVFGGGGSNKKRFNTLSVLDWNTKIWTQIKPKQDETSPWERTYHSAQYIAPYLIVYGGQGMADLDDLWIFNLHTERWKQVVFSKNKTKPCGRRFHTSALIKNEMYIIAGCHGRYRSLNDIFSLDLSPLLKTGQTVDLEWKQRKLTGDTFLSRWGHTSTVLNQKIYLFGGRFSNDLNDLLVIDIQSNTMKTVKGITGAPTPRRRHCAGFLGNCLVVFGGFNGQYFNDLYYVCLNEQKNYIVKSQHLNKLLSLVNNPETADLTIQDVKGQNIYLNKYFMMQALGNNQQAFVELLEELKEMTSDKIIPILKFCYCGLGDIPITLQQRFKIIGEQERPQYRNYYNMLKTRFKGRWIQSTSLWSANQNSGVLKLKQEEFSRLFEDHSQLKQIHIRCGGNRLRVNKLLASLASPFFEYTLSGDFQETDQIMIHVQTSEDVFRTFVKFIEYDIVLCPQYFSQIDYIELQKLAQYCGMDRLTSICQYQLSLTVAPQSQNLNQMFELASKYKLENFKNHCAEVSVKRIQKYEYKMFDDAKGHQIQLAKTKYLKNNYLDLQYSKWQQYQNATKIIEKQHSNKDYSKENSQVNS